jgi:hypothetical protein
MQETAESYQWYSVCPNITSKFHSIAMFKSFIKQNSYWSTTCRYVYGLSCTTLNLFKFSGSWVVSMKQNVYFTFQPPFMFVFLFFSQKFFNLRRSVSIQNFMVPFLLVQVLHPSQKSECLPSWNNGWSYGIEKYVVEITFNGMTSLLNFMKSTNWFKGY